jgi:hypothetical protein
VPFVLVRIQGELGVGELKHVIETDSQGDDEAKQGNEADGQSIDLDRGLFHGSNLAPFIGSIHRNDLAEL